MAKAREDEKRSKKKEAEKGKKVDLYAAKESSSKDLVSDDSDDDAFEDWDFGPDRDRKNKSDEPPVKRALLQKRDYKVDLDSKLGKSVVITKNAPSSQTGG